MKKVCPTCHGSGESTEVVYSDTIPCVPIKKPCSTCGGTGEIEE